MANSVIKCPSSDEFMAALDALKDTGDVIGIPAPDDITDVIIAWANGVKPGDTKNIASRSVSLQRGIEIGMCIMHARQEQALQDAYDKGFHEGHRRGRISG